MMYYLPYLFLICMARDLGTCLGVGICIHMRTRCLDFDICDAFESFDRPLMQRLARDHRYVL